MLLGYYEIMWPGSRAVSAFITCTNDRAPDPSGSRVNSVQNATRTPHDANLRAVGLGQAIQVQMPVGESNAILPHYHGLR